MQRDVLDLRSEPFKDRDWREGVAIQERDALAALPHDATKDQKAFALCKCRYGFMIKDMDLPTFSAIRSEALKLKRDKRWLFMMREFNAFASEWRHRTGHLA